MKRYFVIIRYYNGRYEIKTGWDKEILNEILKSMSEEEKKTIESLVMYSGEKISTLFQNDIDKVKNRF